MWQLNSKWQPVGREIAFDPKLSTLKAKEIYVAWGNNFNAWSANKLIK